MHGNASRPLGPAIYHLPFKSEGLGPNLRLEARARRRVAYSMTGEGEELPQAQQVILHMVADAKALGASREEARGQNPAHDHLRDDELKAGHAS